MNNVASKYIISHTFYPHVSQKVIFLKYISMLHVLAVAKHSLNTTFVLVVCWHIFLPKFKLYKKFFKYKIWSPNRDPQSRPYLSFNLSMITWSIFIQPYLSIRQIWPSNFKVAMFETTSFPSQTKVSRIVYKVKL